MSAAKLYRTIQKINAVKPEVLAVKMELHYQAATLYGPLNLGHHSYIYVFVDTLGNPQRMEADAFEALYEPVEREQTNEQP